MPPRRVVFMVHPGCVTLDLAGPLEVFAIATRLGPPKALRYKTEMVTLSAGRVPTSGGVDL